MYNRNVIWYVHRVIPILDCLSELRKSDDCASNFGTSNKYERLCGVNPHYKVFIKFSVFWKIQIVICINLSVRQATSTMLSFI